MNSLHYARTERRTVCLADVRVTKPHSMRLIDVNTLKLHEFFGDQIPPYAILPHTWEAEEVTYEEWLYDGRQYPWRWGWVYDEEEVDNIKSKTGYHKIAQACLKAQGDSLSLAEVRS
ncbi:hypothetical protein RRF57_009325 [Xylaria bambusicola]|uniref:Uncharacterized protein n=1 Tax=Xylaria bambusicola TaxID=326684 RepID=A0AAN7UWM8_9PEZI